MYLLPTTRGYPPAKLASSKCLQPTLPALLFVCRQFLQEVKVMLYSSVSFSFPNIATLELFIRRSPGRSLVENVALGKCLAWLDPPCKEMHPMLWQHWALDFFAGQSARGNQSNTSRLHALTVSDHWAFYPVKAHCQFVNQLHRLSVPYQSMG